MENMLMCVYIWGGIFLELNCKETNYVDQKELYNQQLLGRK